MSFGALAFTPLVKELQERYGSRAQYARLERDGLLHARLTDFEKDFIADRDSFYWATVGATGWPNVQHRGGPKGFLKLMDDETLAFADFRGNKQYISTGNLMSDSRVAMILMDYPRQGRLKILGQVRILEGASAESWLPQVQDPGYKATIERVFTIKVEAYDWNCSQHITPRYTAEEVRAAVRGLEDKLDGARAENERLREELAEFRSR